jgi:SAM-dependent methyltransferase
MRNLAASPWNRAETVAGFANSAPNRELMRFAAVELARTPNGCAVDVGCGAGRNTVPLAESGWVVVGVDLSRPMLHAAVERARRAGLERQCRVVASAMDRLPLRDQSADLVIAHGIWNLARSAAEFRAALRDAARVAKTGAGLFVFTFSRSTLPVDAIPVRGEPFVFTDFSGEPQCFLTDEQLFSELARVGFTPDSCVPVRELNRPRPGNLCAGRAPVIYEGTFRLRA